MKTHMIIPDSQVKAGVDTSYLTWIGKYIVDKKPDVVIHLGDFADMPSLSSYDKGKKCFEGRRYNQDVKAVHEAMNKLLLPLREEQKRHKKNKKAAYSPRMVMLLGNHENRISRAAECEPILDGTISVEDLGYAEAGWEVVPFLQPVIIDGVSYCHYFPRSANGRVLQTRRGSPSAKAQVTREGVSCTSGHLQGLDYAIHMTGNGLRQGLIAGSCYLHDEDYLSPQGHHYWKGIVMKHEVVDGHYDPMMVSLDYLRRRYGKKRG